MLSRRIPFWISLALLALGAAVACDLNPQPLPPGDTATGTSADAGDFGAVPTGGGGSPDGSATVLGSEDAGGVTSVSDAGGAAPGDAGDAGDASDAGEQDAGDAATDAAEAGNEDAGDAEAVDGSADADKDSQ